MAVVRNNNREVANRVARGVFVPGSSEGFGDDPDGNLTSDGRWTYTWDAENRLIRMVATTVGPQPSIRFEYDAQGRRIGKRVWDNARGNGKPSKDIRFAYDQWNLISEMSSDLRPVSTFTWGLDLSGSLQGAGGVGGLLVESQISGGAVTASQFAMYDGNGNVAALASATDGTVAARYEYGPFGEVIRITGAMAKANPFRFSTKYQDEETDLVYYGYRYYSPSMGRWLSKDPINEDGGLNLYGFAGNIPVNNTDKDGRSYTCADVCRLARHSSRFNSGLGGVVCFKGMKCACVFDGMGRNYGDCPELDKILQKHEDEHAKRHSCDKCVPNMYRMRGPEEEECELRKQSLQEMIDYLNKYKGKASKKCYDAAEQIAGELQRWVTDNCP